MKSVIQEVQNKYSFLDNLLTNFWKSWTKSNLTVKLQIKNIKWKNEKAKPGYAYKPTDVSNVRFKCTKLENLYFTYNLILRLSN